MNTLLKLRSKKIGRHVGYYKDIWKNIIFSNKFGLESFSFFMGKPVSWNKNILCDHIYKFNYFLNKFNFNTDFILPHGSYLVNFGSPFKNNLFKSINLSIKEINYCNRLNLKLINYHIGSHLGCISINKCIDNVIMCLNYILSSTKKIILLIENSAGQGNSIGYDLFHISEIISGIEIKSRIGVCIDTCHAYAAGYRFSNYLDCNKFFINFDNLIGINYLKAIHLNGSKYWLNSRRDKHSTIINSNLKNIIIYWIMNNNIFNNIPIILETPNKLLWRNEINWLFSISN